MVGLLIRPGKMTFYKWMLVSYTTREATMMAKQKLDIHKAMYKVQVQTGRRERETKEMMLWPPTT